jgi:hypothetical protein
LFYNSPALNWLVFLQSFLTLFGNSTMAFAAYRIYAYEKSRTDGDAVQPLPQSPLEESDNKFLLDMLAKSLLASLVVKYGELAFDFPFEAGSATAAAFVALPTLANVLKWQSRSVQAKPIV